MEGLCAHLASEVHDPWLNHLDELVRERALPVHLVGVQAEHGRSDAVGENILDVRAAIPRYCDLMGQARTRSARA